MLQFEQHGFMLLQNVLTDDENLALNKFVRSRYDEGQWVRAQIGKGSSSNTDSEQRGDFIEWLEEENYQPELLPYWRFTELLRMTLNRHFYLGLNFFESHMACYPKGTFYKRHSDVHRSGSTRKVSFVYYLNLNWDRNSGGMLNIYKENEIKATLIPKIGHCIAFLSEIEHEVTLSEDSRYSITGWFHQKKN